MGRIGYKSCRALKLGLALGAVIVALGAGLVGCDNPLAAAAQTARQEAVSPDIGIKSATGQTLSPDTPVNIGSLGLLASLDYTITIQNTGKTALVMDHSATQVVMGAGTEAGAFSIVSMPSSIPVGASGSLILRFTRGTAGGKLATLTIRTNDALNPTISLSLQGVSLDPSSKDITGFSIKNPACVGILSGDSISVFVPNDTPNITMLIAEFTTTGSAVRVGAAVQDSGVTTNDFSTNQTYRVTSLDGLSTKDYTVSVIKNPAAPALVPHDRAIEVSWSAIANASAYEIWYYAGNMSGSAVKYGPDIAAPTTSASISGLVNGTSYYVWIKALYAGGLESGLGLASPPAIAAIKYFGWLYGHFSDGYTIGISRYSVDLETGALSGVETRVSSELTSGGGVTRMEIDPSHGFLFFSYKRDNNSNPPYMINSAKIDPHTGALTENGPPIETNSSQAIEDLVISPDGKHLYASAGYITGGVIYCWDVDGTSGALSNQRSYSSGVNWAMGMAVNPAGTLLYVVDYNNSAIRIYDIGASTGSLSYRSSFSTVQYPMGVAFSPNTNRLLVSCQQSTSDPVLTIGAFSFELDALGIPTGSPPWTTTLATDSKLWRNILAMPVYGSSTQDCVFALESGGGLRSFGNDQNLSFNYYSYSAGGNSADETLLTLPSGDTYLYAANRNANIASFKVDSPAATLVGPVDTLRGNGSPALRGIVMPW